MDKFSRYATRDRERTPGWARPLLKIASRIVNRGWIGKVWVYYRFKKILKRLR